VIAIERMKDAKKEQQRKQSTKYTFLPTRQAVHPSNTEITLFGGEVVRSHAAGRLGSMVRRRKLGACGGVAARSLGT
jgi:hypothetical protein